MPFVTGEGALGQCAQPADDWLTGDMVLPTAPHRLATLRRGEPALVEAVLDDHAAELAREGIRPGVELLVESATPFGGPLIVRVGRARVAVARRVAATIAISQPPATAGERR